MESTFVLLKPDCAERKIIGQCLSYFEKKEFDLQIHEIRCIKKPRRQDIFDHYAHLPAEVVEEICCYFIASFPLYAVDLRGPEAVAKARAIIGATDPSKAEKMTIRGDLGVDSFVEAAKRSIGHKAIRNLVHASDSVENAMREWTIWMY